MTNKTPPPALRLLVLITTPKLAEQAAGLFDREGVPLQYRLHAQGTASSEMLEVLGLGGTERTMLLGLLPKKLARELLSKLPAGLRRTHANNGIAYTVALTGASSPLVQVLTAFRGGKAALSKEKDVKLMADTEQSMILTVVDQGFSETVMEAARPAGAAGGTVISSRYLPNAESHHLGSISVQQEKELVLIIADNEKKLAIMQAVSERCGGSNPAHGVVFSVPVEDMIGI